MEPENGSDDEDFSKTFIDDPSILDKYKAASEIADKALKHVVSEVKDGADIATICEIGDKFMEEELKKVYCGKKTKKIERGIAHPTCCSVNNICMNYSPLKEESVPLKTGDVVKLELGCHIDGYFGIAGTTVVCGQDKVDGVKGNLVKATHTAFQAAFRTLVEGKTNEDVTAVVAKVAEQFGVVPLEGAYSSKHKKHAMDDVHLIMNKAIPEKRTEKYEFARGDVFGLEVILATGEGKPRMTDHRTTVFNRVVLNSYMLKSKAAREFFSKVNTKFPSLPFSLRYFDDDITSAKIGIKHCLENELVEPHEVMDVKEGEIVASMKGTVAILPSGTAILCSGSSVFVEENFVADRSVEDAKLASLLAQSMDLQEQKARRKAQAGKPEEEKKE